MADYTTKPNGNTAGGAPSPAGRNASAGRPTGKLPSESPAGTSGQRAASPEGEAKGASQKGEGQGQKSGKPSNG